jgi:hypothetical protein
MPVGCLDADAPRAREDRFSREPVGASPGRGDREPDRAG